LPNTPQWQVLAHLIVIGFMQTRMLKTRLNPIRMSFLSLFTDALPMHWRLALGRTPTMTQCHPLLLQYQRFTGLQKLQLVFGSLQHVALVAVFGHPLQMFKRAPTLLRMMTVFFLTLPRL
jgi:hypothetical protein